MTKQLNAECSICHNSSGYDKDSLKASTWNINGIKTILCCPCEDDLKKRLNAVQVKRLTEWIKNNNHHLMSDDVTDLISIRDEFKARYD